jgi:anaerobic magnesium-protoporphyrin IX monomethyl ester cyclase
MKVLLAYPPDRCLPTIPYSSLAQLSAVLKHAGHDCVIRDVNAETFAWLNHRERLAGYFDFAVRRIAELEAKPALSEQERGIYRFLAPLVAAPRETILFAPEAAAIMKDPERFYDPDQFNRAFDALATMIKVAYSANPVFDPENRFFVKQSLDALAQPYGDPVSDAYSNGIVDSLLAEQPDLVGFTLPFSFQFFEMLKLAKLIKQRAPHVKIVVGGPTFNDYAYRLFENADLSPWIDFGVAGEGERALVGLANALANGTPFDAVPNLHWFEGEPGAKTVRKSPLPPDVPDLNEFPSPDFRGITFDHYLSPARIANLQTSRGCYYGKCTFCGDGFRRNFRLRAPDKIYDDVKKIHVDCGVDHFLFWDSLAPPKTLKHVALNIKKNNDRIWWFAETKFEKPYTNPELMKTLGEGGCRFLQFGFESGSQRVLDLIDKGNDIERVDVILGLMKQNRIHAGVSWFIGFPTATPQEDLATYDFVATREDRIVMSVYAGTFMLGRDTLVYANPERYGIKIVEKDDGSIDYQMNDGTPHYDRTELDLAFRARGDLPLLDHGGYLLYAAHRPELLKRITGLTRYGHLARDYDDLPRRAARLAEGLRFRDYRFNPFAADDAAMDRPVRVAFQEKTGTHFALEAAEVKVLEAADGRRSVGDLAAAITGRGRDADAALALVARLIDRGLLTIPASVAPAREPAFAH